MGIESIIVLILVSLLVIYVITQTIAAWKKHASFSLIPFILMIIGVIFAILVIYQGDELKVADLAQILLMIGLVTITAVYASSTQKIARETKEQRYSESLPLLVPDMTPTNAKWPQKFPPNEVAFECIKTGVTVAWHNSGKGIAINARFAYWAPPHESRPGKVPYIERRESKVLQVEKEIVVELESGHQWCDEPKQYRPRLEAEYQDIYERKIVTVQEFRIEEENGNKKAFLGELYFTVNGKRLGEEATRHD